jgi:hypothetical protein
VVSRDRSDFGGTTRGTNLGEKVNVRPVVLAPLARKVILVIDGFNWANWFASTTVNTFIWVDIEHSITLVYTVDGALIDTSLVFDVDARKGYYVSHVTSLTKMSLYSASHDGNAI